MARAKVFRGSNQPTYMANYDFRNLLSAFEFECFSRDLINAHEGLDLASFAEGRDGGIDLRYTHGKDKKIIVQAKRYKDYKELKPVLKKEVEKVQKLKPTRYMLTTSADLTSANKQEIISWFNPYIQNENDILAKQDLNKLLDQHPDIERNYYKLWLASTNVLNSIIHKNITNWTSFERSEIENTIRTYVMNDSFDEALTKLINNHFVIISGEPGIGKTTLARILVMHLLADQFKDQHKVANYEEFYYTSGNIDDLASVMQEGKRQVFFYDDFMGQITLEEGEKNFENRIIAFIRACQARKDKLLILTTREYILQQGMTRYPKFKTGEIIEISKCIIDLGKYTRFVRAQILYNHLVTAQIPQPYINAILKNKNYLKIIDHPHFSPRIIETFLTNKTHERCTPENYFKIIISYFDHPDSVWLDAFKLLTPMAQEALLVLNTMGTPVMHDDWKEAYNHFFQQVHTTSGYLSDHQWRDIVKVIQNNFIRVEKGRGGLYINFHNPGIKDVLTRYIAEDDKIKSILLEHAYYIEQVFGVFKENNQMSHQERNLTSLHEQFFNIFDKIWSNYKSCRVLLHKYSKNDQFYARSPYSKIEILLKLLYEYKVMLSTRPWYVEQKITQELLTGDEFGNLQDQLSLLERIDLSKTALNMEALFVDYKTRLYYSYECLNLAESIEKLFPNHIDYLESDEFCKITVENLTQELEDVNNSELGELDSTTKELCRYIPYLEHEPIVENISEQYTDYNNYMESLVEGYIDDYKYGYGRMTAGEDAKAIDNLFDTIKE